MMTSSVCNTPTRLHTSETERLVNRLKNSNPEKFESMVKMHLSFLLDLSGSQLEEFLDPPPGGADTVTSSNESRSKLKGFSFSKKKALRDKETKSKQVVFGQPLNQQAIELVFPLIEYLHRPECLAEEGLFRKSGHASRQRHLQERVCSVQEMEALEAALERRVYTPHDCAGGLKIFLRELPEPLLTNRHYVAYCQIPGMKSQTKQLHSIQLLLQLLPQPNYILLQLLLHLLHRVAREPTNKMTSSSLATLFAPHVLVPRSTHAHDLQAESCNVTQVVAFMIDNFRVIFMPPEPLVRDIRLYWEEMEGANQSALSGSSDAGMTSEDELDGCTCPRFKRKHDPSDDALMTTVCFTDREASRVSEDFTRTQVAQLYAYVSSMPDSPKKRKLVKQFNKYSFSTPGSNTPHTPSCENFKRGLGDSIKKIIAPVQRRNSYDITKEDLTPRKQKTLSVGTPLHMSGCRLRQKNIMRHEKFNTSTDTEISVESSSSGHSYCSVSTQGLNDAMLASPANTTRLSGDSTLSAHTTHQCTSLSAQSENNVSIMDSSEAEKLLSKFCAQDNVTPTCATDMIPCVKSSGLPCIGDMEDKENSLVANNLPVLDKLAPTLMDTYTPKLKVANQRIISRSLPTLSKPIRT